MHRRVIAACRPTSWPRTPTPSWATQCRRPVWLRLCRMRAKRSRRDGVSPGPSTRARAMIVDAHAHVWSSDPERYPWHPTFGYVPRTPATPQALLARMDALGIQLALLAQPSVYGADHRFLLV